MSQNEYDVFTPCDEQIQTSKIDMDRLNDFHLILRSTGCDARHPHPTPSDRNPASNSDHKLVPTIRNSHADNFIYQSPHT